MCESRLTPNGGDIPSVDVRNKVQDSQSPSRKVFPMAKKQDDNLSAVPENYQETVKNPADASDSDLLAFVRWVDSGAVAVPTKYMKSVRVELASRYVPVKGIRHFPTGAELVTGNALNYDMASLIAEVEQEYRSKEALLDAAILARHNNGAFRSQVDTVAEKLGEAGDRHVLEGKQVKGEGKAGRYSVLPGVCLEWTKNLFGEVVVNSIAVATDEAAADGIAELAKRKGLSNEQLEAILAMMDLA